MRNGKLKQPNGIINADCYKSMKDISRNSVKLVITSPPYNIGKEYEKKYLFLII